MIKVIRWYYAISALTLGFLLVGAGLLFWQYSALAVLSPDPNLNNVKGWAWSGNTGWISLNSQNCIKLNVGRALEDYICDITPNVDYGVRLLVNPDGTGGEIKGYGWSQNLGWICFGDGQGDNTKGCSGPSPDDSPLIIEFLCKNNLNQVVTCNTPGIGNPKLTGWGKILNLGEEGWIKLSGAIGGGGSYGVRLAFEDPINQVEFTQLQGWMWQNAGGTGSSDAYGVGWICLGDDPIFCSFNRPEVLFPYLRAEGGDIFAKRISTFFPPPRDKYNAQYLIHVLDSSGIDSWFTSECVKDPISAAICKQRYGLDIPAPDPTNINDPFNFKLGRFDFHGLSDVVKNIVPDNTLGMDGRRGENKYNMPVVSGTNSFPGGPWIKFGNKVYVVTSDLTIGSERVFENGLSGESGAGTIIVNGNLYINNNITYEAGEMTDRSRLASIVWIVMGDVIINPGVEKVAGSFIVLGQRKSAMEMQHKLACTSPDSVNYRKYCSAAGARPECGDINNINSICGEMPKCFAFDQLKSGQQTGDIYPECGWFDTGTGSDNPLTVYGSVFARQFKLSRSYIDVVSRSPAEKFIADGRLQLNPPPGLSDFAKGLPSFRRQ
ncbi:MAG: hypothetical protein V1712_04070 [Patescibacteria group bacterium]